MDEKLRWAFQLYDINGDGTIAYEEMLSEYGECLKTEQEALDLGSLPRGPCRSRSLTTWSLSLFPLTAIVRSIYKMTGQMVKLPADEDTPEKVRLGSGRRKCRCGSHDPPF